MSIKHGNYYSDIGLRRLYIYRTDLLDHTYIWPSNVSKICNDYTWVTGGLADDPKQLYSNRYNAADMEERVEDLKLLGNILVGNSPTNDFELTGAL